MTAKGLNFSLGRASSDSPLEASCPFSFFSSSAMLPHLGFLHSTETVFGDYILH
jgi:hypothetical protein